MIPAPAVYPGRRDYTMSSYIISKQEYMKAAGLVSGIASEKEVWIYDFEKGRNSTPEDYKRRFTDIFQMNAASVKEQYHGDNVGVPGEDPDEYADAFNGFYKLGKQLCYNGGAVLRKGIDELNSFFGSILYQIENDDYNEKAANYLDKVLVALYKAAAGRELDSWGTLEIETPANIYQPLF